MNIVDFIPHGEINAISRKDLRKVTGLTDRVMRERIAEARRDTPILNTQHGRGYFIPLPEETALVERYLKQETSRARSIFWSLQGVRKFLNGGGNSA